MSATYRAVFNYPNGPVTSPVHSFDDQGYALVVDHIEGRLIRAATKPGFVRLLEDPRDEIVAAIPWTGRTAMIDDPNDPDHQKEVPVVGWAINVNGWGEPLLLDEATGSVSSYPRGQCLGFIPTPH